MISCLLTEMVEFVSFFFHFLLEELLNFDLTVFKSKVLAQIMKLFNFLDRPAQPNPD